MKTAAIYRAYYGSDWIRQSLASIYPFVDEIWVFTTNQPFGGRASVRYRGAEVFFPHDIDGVGAAATAWAADHDYAGKVRVEHNPFGQQLEGGIGRIVRDLVMPRTACDHVLLVETDQVWPADALAALLAHAAQHPDQLEWSADQQLFWRSPRFCFRRPPDTYLRNIVVRAHGIEDTGFGLSTGHPATLPPGVVVQNFGYASAARTIFWKHLACLSFSRDLGVDSPPREDWFDQVWLPWSWSRNRRTDICPSAGAPTAFSPPGEFPPEQLVPGVRDMTPLPDWSAAE